jgi:hypothetical protein
MKVIASNANEKVLRWTARAQLVLGAAFAGTFVFFCFWTRFPVPYRDDWDWLIAALTKPLSASALFTPHNEHLIPLPRLLYDLQYRVAGPSAVPMFVFALALQLSLAWIVFGEIRRSWADQPAQRSILIGLSAALLFSSYQLQSIVFTAAMIFPLVQTLAAISVVCWLNAGNSARDRGWWLAASVSTSVLAVLTTTNGFALPATLAVLSMIRGDRRTAYRAFMIVFSVAVIMYVVLVLLHVAPPSRLPIPEDPRPSIGTLATFTLSFLGSGVAYGSIALSVIVGSIGWAIGIGAGWSVLRARGRAPRIVFFALALMLFSALSGGMAAIGRARFGTLQAAQSRYATYALTYWVAAILFLADRFRQGLATQRRATVVIGVLALSASVVLFAAHLVTGAVWRAKRDNIAAAGLAVSSAVHDDEWLATLYPVPSVIYEAEGALRAGSDNRLLDSRLGVTFPDAGPSCTASLDLERIDSGSGLRVTGEMNDRAIDGVVIDRALRIRGIVRPAPLVDTPVPQTPAVISAVIGQIRRRWPISHEWLGFTQTGAGAPYTLVALNKQGGAVCTAKLVVHGRIRVALDQVTFVNGTMVAGGWALECNAGGPDLIAVVDGAPHPAEFTRSLPRPDVDALYGGSCANAPDTGFQLRIESLPPGSHELYVRAVGSAGRPVDSSVLKTHPSRARGSLREIRVIAVARMEHGRLDGPLDAKDRIVPANTPLSLGRIVRRHVVEDFGLVGEGHIAVGAPLGDIQHPAMLRRQFHAKPFLERRGLRTQVHEHVKHRAGRAPHQLGLLMGRDLVVKSTQRASAHAACDIALQDATMEALRLKGLEGPHASEGASLVTKQIGIDHERVRNAGGRESHPDLPADRDRE